jgi:hypothetical protein
MIVSKSAFAAYQAPTNGGWIGICEVLPYPENYPGMQGAEILVSYYCIQDSRTESRLLIFPLHHWG